MLYKFSTIQHDYHAQQNCPGSSLSPAQKTAEGGPQPPFSTSTHAPSLSGILPSPPSSPPTSPPSLSSPPSLYPHLLSPSTLPPPPTLPPPRSHPSIPPPPRTPIPCGRGSGAAGASGSGRGAVGSWVGSGPPGSIRVRSAQLGSARLHSAPRAGRPERRRRRASFWEV